LTDVPTLGRSEYLRFCEVLRVSPDDSLSPAARASSLPAWICGELIATEPARTRLLAWIDAGRPGMSADAIFRRMWFMGSPNTRRGLQDYLLAAHVAPPAVWHLVERIATIAIGASEAGLAHRAPPARCAQQIVIIDRHPDPFDTISLFLHELAHLFLLPVPAVLDDLADVVLTGSYWEFAASAG